MSRVPISGYEKEVNKSDQPRRLTDEEINFIIEQFPLPPSADEEAAILARQGVIEWMSDTLRDIVLCPSAIPEFVKRIIEQHYKSLAIPGTSIGTTAAEAVGATTTQMTLNSVAPWEEILFQDSFGKGHKVKIGEWIDDLLSKFPSKIQHIPENRTEYLELDSPVYIATCNENGKSSWEKITAVTRHLPVGDLVKIKTKSGREVTATQSKSLLIWDGNKLVGTEGKDVKVGDKVPVFVNLPDPPKVWNEETHSKCLDLPDPTNMLFSTKEIIKAYLSVLEKVNFSLDQQELNYLKYRLNLHHEQEVVNDIMLDPIISIEMISGVKYVYDLTEPVTKNFSLYNGLCCRDTFHSSGSAKSASFGIDAMRDIIFARKNPKNESCTIRYVNKRASYEEILNSRQYIVGSMISDFVKDYDIDSPNNMKRYWWHDTASIMFDKQLPNATAILRLFLNVDEMYKHKVSISDLVNALEREAPPKVIAIHGPISDGIIDVYPDLNFITETIKNKNKSSLIVPEMAELTFFETIVYPELSNIRVKGVAGIKQIYPIVAPVWSMVAHERKMEKEDLKNNKMVELFEQHLGDAWMLYYNHNVMKTTGLIPFNLGALCDYAGLTVLKGLTRISQGNEIDDRLVVKVPKDRFRTDNGDTVIDVNNLFYRKRDDVEIIDNVYYRVIPNSLISSTENGWLEVIDIKDKDKITEFVNNNEILNINGKIYRKIESENLLIIDSIYYEKITNNKIKVKELEPGKYVLEKITLAKRQYKDMLKKETDVRLDESKNLSEQKRKRFLRTKTKVIKPNILNASEYIYSETDGSNLRGVLSLPQIDKTRTTCNNMHVIASTLGIEATRSFIIRALHNTITNTGSYVHPANIAFIAEFMTGRGVPYGATFTGISRGAGGHLSLATLERAGKVFIQNALHGRKEDIRNVSASVAVGSRMAIGDGMFDIAQNIGDKTIVNDDLFKATTSEPQKISSETDIMAELASLKSMKTVGDVFDYAGGEKENNLYTEFLSGEVIPDVSLARKTKPQTRTQIPQEKIHGQPELVPILDTVNIAKNSMKQPIIEYEPPNFVPLKATGLVTDIIPGIITQGIPDELSDLFNRYSSGVQEELGLPVFKFDRIVGPSSAIEIRKEQIKGLVKTTKQ